MDYVKFYQMVAREFDEATAVCAVVAATVLLNKKIKTRHTNTKGLFTSEVIGTLREKLFEHREVDPVLCFACVMAWGEYCDRISLQGLGGCVVTDFGVLVIKHVAQLNRHAKGPKE
mgnify:CR=1 FL=1